MNFSGLAPLYQCTAMKSIWGEAAMNSGNQEPVTGFPAMAGDPKRPPLGTFATTWGQRAKASLTLRLAWFA